MKNKLFVSIFIFILTTGMKVSAQVIITDSSTKMNVPDKMPEFKRGLNGWTDFLAAKLDRDLLQREGAPPGKYLVIVSFLIEADGSVNDIKIEYDRGYHTGDEVKSIIKLTNKKWIPAYDKGKPVAFRHRQSITFLNN
jgi:hypothetical protein